MLGYITFTGTKNYIQNKQLDAYDIGFNDGRNDVGELMLDAGTGDIVFNNNTIKFEVQYDSLRSVLE